MECLLPFLAGNTISRYNIACSIFLKEEYCIQIFARYCKYKLIGISKKRGVAQTGRALCSGR